MDIGLFRGISLIDTRGIIWFGFGKGLFKYDPLQLLLSLLNLKTEIKSKILYWSGNYRYNVYVYVAAQYSSGLYKIDLSDGSF